MKFKKIIFATSLLIVVLFCNSVYAQSKSKEALGKAMVASIQNDDLDSFKALLLPKEVVLKYQYNHDLENTDQQTQDSLMAEHEAAYDHKVIPRYEEKFKQMVKLNQASNVNWSHLNFLILYKAESKGEEYIPFFIDTKLNHSDYRHFYFDAVRYKGEWYFSGNMELTKGEKYALK